MNYNITLWAYFFLNISLKNKYDQRLLELIKVRMAPNIKSWNWTYFKITRLRRARILNGKRRRLKGNNCHLRNGSFRACKAYFIYLFCCSIHFCLISKVSYLCQNKHKFDTIDTSFKQNMRVQVSWYKLITVELPFVPSFFLSFFCRHRSLG